MRAATGTAFRCTAVALAGLLAGSVAAADAAAVPAEIITGTWASTRGAERLVFMPGGYFRTCFVNGRQGNAAMGQWKRLSAGLYAVEFTHTATPDCNSPLQPIRKHPASIRGQVRLSQGELALYVSGEFPPDLYRPLTVSTPK
jgi:hypothetical protein